MQKKKKKKKKKMETTSIELRCEEIIENADINEAEGAQIYIK